MKLEISKEDMIVDINDHLTGLLESWTCGLSEPFDASKNYILFKDWVKPDGTVAKLVVPGSIFVEAWKNCGEAILPKFFETASSSTFVERLWKKIKNIR